MQPSDGRLRCLDGLTGRLHWEAAEFEVVQLLGVVRDQLLLTTPAGIRCLETRTGAESWRQPTSGRVRTAGRGPVAGDIVLWPTTAGLRALDVRTGLPAASPASEQPPTIRNASPTPAAVARIRPAPGSGGFVCHPLSIASRSSIQ